MPVVDERARHELYLAFEGLMDREKTDTLMSLLPPVGWADVATKHDLTLGLDALRSDLDAVRNELLSEMRHLEERMNLRFEAVDHRFDALEHKMSSKLDAGLRSVMRVMVLSIVISHMTMTSILLTVVMLVR